MSGLEYANKLAKPSRFALVYIAIDDTTIIRFEDRLAPYVRHQLAKQPI